MTIKEVSDLLGVGTQTIRVGLQLGVYDFGVAFKKPGSSTYTYTIYPARVHELAGR